MHHIFHPRFFRLKVGRIGLCRFKFLYFTQVNIYLLCVHGTQATNGRSRVGCHVIACQQVVRTRVAKGGYQLQLRCVLARFIYPVIVISNSFANQERKLGQRREILAGKFQEVLYAERVHFYTKAKLIHQFFNIINLGIESATGCTWTVAPVIFHYIAAHQPFACNDQVIAHIGCLPQVEELLCTTIGYIGEKVAGIGRNYKILALGRGG